MTRLHYANIITVAPAPAASTQGLAGFRWRRTSTEQSYFFCGSSAQKAKLKVVEAEGNDGNAIRGWEWFSFCQAERFFASWK